MNLAFKCTYNDADEGVYVGFNGTCSINNIIRNIKGGRIWCSNEECPCRRFYDTGFRGEAPEYHCYESELFNRWRFGGGIYRHGKHAGKPIKIRKAEVGKIAILTTLFPGDKEKDRKIIGLFKVERIEDAGQTLLYADDDHRLRLPLEEAKELDFWNYYSVSGRKPRWGTHLFRYLSDEAVARILLDLEKTIRDENSRKVVKHLLAKDFTNVGIPPKPPGMLRKKRSRKETITRLRKYGHGGEGQDHKRLKEWIAEHPEEIGIKNVKNTVIEYSFCCGDTVDILFELKDGNDIVVEVETLDQLPGCHQAIKYRALRCAERGIPLDSDKVAAYLVAWDIPDVVASFCNKYNIICQRLRLDG